MGATFELECSTAVLLTAPPTHTEPHRLRRPSRLPHQRPGRRAEEVPLRETTPIGDELSCQRIPVVAHQVILTVTFRSVVPGGPEHDDPEQAATLIGHQVDCRLGGNGSRAPVIASRSSSRRRGARALTAGSRMSTSRLGFATP